MSQAIIIFNHSKNLNEMYQLEKFLDLGHVLSREELRNIKGGVEAPPDCGPNQNAYTCTVTINGASSSAGWGCGTTASQANKGCETSYAEQGIYVDSCICS